MSFSASVHAKAIELCRLAIDMTSEAGSGHPTSAASLAHLVTVLMYDHMRYDPAHPDHLAADRLVLSEGHACPIIYAAGADLGLAIGKNADRRRPMTREDVRELRAIDSPIDGHPNPREGFPFFPAATGSLGQGLSIAAGLALAARLDGIRKRIFCLIGDGESREGQIWEAIDFMVDYQLTGVCPIFNCNGFGQTGKVSPQQSPESLAAKLEGFGARVELIDGHDPDAIRNALDHHTRVSEDRDSPRPVAIVARTVKSWGFPVMHGSATHGKPASGDKRQQALDELEAKARECGARWNAADLEIPPVPEVAQEPANDRKGSRGFPSLTQALRDAGQEEMLEQGKLATRKAYGLALRTLGLARADVVALDGDVSDSTYAKYFAEEEALAGRFFEGRIAEQNMMSCAAGLAAGGKVPFLSTFGKFVMRAYDQLEMALVGGANVKIVGSHTGVSLAADGPSQMALPDAAFFRAFAHARRQDGGPMMYVLTPADAFAAYRLTRAMAEHDGACTMRTLRPDVPFLYDDHSDFELGGHRVLAEGEDLLIIAWGYMVHEARSALPDLERRGIRATLVDAYSIPFDRQRIRELARRHDGRVLTIEDNYAAGLGSEVADALHGDEDRARFQQMFVRQVPKSGRTPDRVLDYLGLSAADIVETASRMVPSRV